MPGHVPDGRVAASRSALKSISRLVIPSPPSRVLAMRRIDPWSVPPGTPASLPMSEREIFPAPSRRPA
nr:hypothetical protein [Candidatus Sigynarchaeota archaeon]